MATDIDQPARRSETLALMPGAEALIQDTRDNQCGKDADEAHLSIVDPGPSGCNLGIAVHPGTGVKAGGGPR